MGDDSNNSNDNHSEEEAEGRKNKKNIVRLNSNNFKYNLYNLLTFNKENPNKRY